jgi:hypothetical protein
MILLALGLAGPVAAGEEASVTAFAVWQGQGQTTQTGPNEATFVGVLAGTVYVETEKGPLVSGRIVCPALVKIQLDDSSQTGSGHCTLTATDGAQLFADIECSGFHLIGCQGETKLTGGTGRFAGITGGGAVIIRSERREFAVTTDRSIVEGGAGIIYWRELRYTIP